MLRVLSGPQAGAELALSGQPQLVGSDELNCDVVLFGGGVAPAHCTLRALDGRHVVILPSDDAVTEFNGQHLSMGEHSVEVPGHLRLAGVDVLLYAAQPEAGADDAQASVEIGGTATNSRRRRRTTRWIASALCACGITVFISGAMGWFDKSEPVELARARKMAAELGYRDLAVAYDVEGLLTVTGYVRNELEARQVRDAFRQFPGKSVVVRVAVAGAATQLERTTRSAQPPQRLGGGSLLIDAQASAPEALPVAVSSAGGDGVLQFKVRALRAGEGGYLETSAGMRYFVGSQLPGGYTLKVVADDHITVLRGETEVDVPLRR